LDTQPSVYFDTLFCQNYYFQRVRGAYIILVDIPQGWGNYRFGVKKREIPGRGGGGTLMKFPLWWG